MRAAPTDLAENPSVRAILPEIRQLIDEGIDRSPTFAALIDRLDRSDVIVFVEPTAKPPSGIAGWLAFAGTAGPRRYLRIVFALQLSRNQRIAILGHELQHAAEVADHPDVVDQDSLSEMYRRIGETRADCGENLAFDTTVAVATGRTVMRELTTDNPHY